LQGTRLNCEEPGTAGVFFSDALGVCPPISAYFFETAGIVHVQKAWKVGQRRRKLPVFLAFEGIGWQGGLTRIIQEPLASIAYLTSSPGLSLIADLDSQGTCRPTHCAKP
jgi:hypothetical protein